MYHYPRLTAVLICTVLLAACAPARSNQASSNPAPVVLPSSQPTAAQDDVPTAAPVSLAPAAYPASNQPANPPHHAPVNCPVTTPPDPLFTPPAPYPQSPPGDYFWYGDASLWTALPQNGVWAELPHNPEGYTQKVFWWREGYVWTEEPEPDLTVFGQRLDEPAAPLNGSRATNAFAEDIQSAMLVGVDFPTPGCWEITGRYAGAELSFVVWVEP
jgi:hypothetical protein